MPYKFKLSNTPLSLAWLLRVHQIIKLERPDVINVHTPVPGLPDIATALASRIPVVVNYHAGSMIKGRLATDIFIWFYEHIFMKAMLRRAKRIICSSDFVRGGVMKSYLSKSRTITPAADHKLFYPARTRIAEPKLLFVGSLNFSDMYKGLDTLLQAVAKLKHTTPNLKLTVVGQGDYQKQYEADAQTLGIEKLVEFAGRLEGTQLADAYRASAVFVLPSSNDSFPMVITEAMSTGLPIISTTVGGIPTLVDHGVDGLLVEPKDVAALSQAINNLLSSPIRQQKFGDAGRKKIQRTLNWDIQTQVTSNVLAETIKMPAIVHIASYYPPHIGGLERVAQEIATHQAQNNYQVEVITSNIGAGNAPAIEKSSHMTVRRLKAFEFAHTPIMPSFLWRLWRTPKPEVFHLHLAHAYTAELTWLTAKLRRIPYVVHFHLDIKPSGRLGTLYLVYKQLVTPLVIRGATQVITLTSAQAQLVQKRYKLPPSRIHCIPNGVSEQFLAIGGEKRAANSIVELLFVGRLAPQKRVDRLLDAMVLVPAPCHLTIVGNGENSQALQAQAKQLNLTNVDFVGAHSGEALLQYFRQADVFVLPSDIEGMPLSLLEAMAAGMPIVGSDVLGIRELIKEVGLLVANPTPQTFATELTEIITNAPLRQKLAAQSYAHAKLYSWPQITRQIETIYLKIAS